MLIENIFNAAGVAHLYDTQVELEHPFYPLKAHVDFLFHADLDGTPEHHIIEVKSVSGIPDEPYPQWVDQLAFQLGLLHLKHPKEKLGGSILAIDLNAGKVHQFNGFQYNDAVFNYLSCRALYLLDCLDEKDEARPSVSHTCSYCSYRSDCPAMALPKVQLPPEIEALAGKYADLNGTKSQAEKEMKSIRLELMDFTRGDGQGGDIYTATNIFNLASLNRFEKWEMTYPPAEVEEKILENTFSGKLQANIMKAMVKTAADIRRAYLDGNCPGPISIRDLLRWGRKLIQAWNRKDVAPLYHSFDKAFGNGVDPHVRAMLHTLIQTNFGVPAPQIEGVVP